MDLSNLKPAKGSVKDKKGLEVDKDPDVEVHLQKDIKVQNQDQDIKRKLVLKVDRCHCIGVFRNSGLKILTVLNTEVSILMISKIGR